jgi:hypothetical protein
MCIAVRYFIFLKKKFMLRRSICFGHKIKEVDTVCGIDAIRPANGLGWNNDNSLDFALVSIGLDANKPTLQMDWFGLVFRPTAVCNG